MKKYEFLAQLQKGLNILPAADQRKTLDYYAEMIDERIEDGLTEEEAVDAIGTPEEIAAQIIGDTPIETANPIPPAKPRKKWSAWEIVLLIVGSPIWASLLAAVIAVALALYISVWAIVLSLWAADLSIGAVAVFALLTSPIYGVQSTVWTGIALLGAGLFLAGVCIFLFFGCLQSAKGLCYLTKLLFRGVRNRITKKGA